MKKIQFAAIVLSTQLMLIVAHLYKHTYLIGLSYELQKNEHACNNLREKKQQLNNQLYVLKSNETIRQFAQTTLHMCPIKLSQVKRFVRP